MDKNLEPRSKVNVRDLIGIKTDHGEKSTRYSETGTLMGHVQGHNKEKSNKCNQCDFAFSQAIHLKTHLKTHSGEKPNKCNQCDYASSQAGDLRRHLKTHSGEKPKNVISVTRQPLRQAI